MENAELEFSKKKQLRDGLSSASEAARSMIDASAKLAKLKKLAKQVGGVSFGIEKSNNHVSMKGWLVIGRKRHYFKSRWERNLARYYEWLKVNGEIKDWHYEPERFDFPIKRGTNSYLPDFKIYETNGLITWVEVKGYCTQKDRTKMKRFLKFHPDKRLLIIDQEAYREISKQCKNLIKGWEA